MSEQKTIDITPTWSAVIDVYLDAIRDGSHVSQNLATQELKRMAGIADLYKEQMKRIAEFNQDLDDARNGWEAAVERAREVEKQRDELLAAARKALREMTQTVAPRTSFTDAVDELDAAIAKVK